MENKTVEEMKVYFDGVKEYPNFLYCLDRHVINTKQAVINHLTTISELELRYGKPRKTDDPELKSKFSEMIRRKNRLLNIYHSMQDKSNWYEKLSDMNEKWL